MSQSSYITDLHFLHNRHDTLVFRRGGASKAPPPAKPTEQIPNDCQILKKDSANGNLVMLEKEVNIKIIKINIDQM